MTAPSKHALSDTLGFDIILKVARPGDRVTYADRFGAERTGRLQIVPALSGREHFVLNMGGANGTPAVVDAKNFRTLSPSVDRRNTVAQQIIELQANAAPVVDETTVRASSRARPKA